MINYLKQYLTFALCALIMNIALISPAYLMAMQELSSQEETAQSVEDNEQSDEKESQKPTFAQSWHKVITLRWKELGKADAWNIGAPVVGIAALGAWYYWPKNGGVNVNNVINNNPGPDNQGVPHIPINNGNNNQNPNNPGIPNHIPVRNDNLVNPISLTDLKAELPVDVQSAIALHRINKFLVAPTILPEKDIIMTKCVAVGDNVVVTGNKVAKIWDFNGQLLHTLEEHAGTVHSVAIKGDKVVTGSQDRTVKVWSIHGQCLHTLEGHASHIVSVGISDDMIVSGDANGTVKIWDVNDGKLLHTIEGTYVASVAISNGTIVIGSQDGTIKIMNINGQTLHNVQGYDGYGSVSVAIHNDTVVSGFTADTAVKVWNLYGQLMHTLNHPDYIRSVAISGNKIITASFDMIPRVWSLDGELLCTLRIHSNAIIRFLVAINDKDTIITSAYDSVMIWSWPLSIDLQKSELAPFACMEHTLTIPQADFIARAYDATQVGQEFVIAFPSEDAKIFLSFPMPVKQYLLARLKIRR